MSRFRKFDIANGTTNRLVLWMDNSKSVVSKLWKAVDGRIVNDGCNPVTSKRWRSCRWAVTVTGHVLCILLPNVKSVMVSPKALITLSVMSSTVFPTKLFERFNTFKLLNLAKAKGRDVSWLLLMSRCFISLSRPIKVSLSMSLKWLLLSKSFSNWAFEKAFLGRLVKLLKLKSNTFTPLKSLELNAGTVWIFRFRQDMVSPIQLQMCGHPCIAVTSRESANMCFNILKNIFNLY